MHNRVVVTALAAGLALFGSAVPAQAAKKKPVALPNCAAKKSKTIAQSAEGRIYRVGTTAFACSFKANKRFELGETDDSQNQSQVEDFRFGKGIVGYIDGSCGLVSGSETIVVRNLRTGK